jgi:hypothetical protein
VIFLFKGKMLERRKNFATIHILLAVPRPYAPDPVFEIAGGPLDCCAMTQKSLWIRFALAAMVEA